MIGGVILAIGIVHFSLQIFFIQKENLQAVETAVSENEPEITPAPEKRVITIEPEQFEVKKIKIITVPEIVRTPPVRQKEFVRMPKPVRKKDFKEIRESRAARLRRAERILTGV